MPRSGRAVVPECVYHLTQRGNYKQYVFFSDENRKRYLFWLQEYNQKYQMQILAYCLMDNHVHSVAIPEQEDSFANTLRILHSRYAYYIHESNDLKGHLWQGRYYSCLLQPCFVGNVIRYVEQNPVRAGMVSLPWEWGWSSASAHAFGAMTILRLHSIGEYVDLAGWKEELLAYEDEKRVEYTRQQLYKKGYLGSDEYVKQVEVQFGLKIARASSGRPKNRDRLLFFKKESVSVFPP